jgi:hypothetical protein
MGNRDPRRFQPTFRPLDRRYFGLTIGLRPDGLAVSSGVVLIVQQKTPFTKSHFTSLHPMKTTAILALLGLALMTGNALHAQAAEVREWTDKTSGKKISAAMVSADPKARTVTLQAGGQTYQLSVDRLVEADLTYIKAQLTRR